MTDDDPWAANEDADEDEEADRRSREGEEAARRDVEAPGDEDPSHRDPFAPRDATTGERADPAPDAGEPAGDAGRGGGETGEGAVAEPGDDGGAPMADLAREVRERRQRRERDDSTDLFESVDVGELDSEAVWESLAATDAEGEEREAGSGSEAEARSASTAGTGVGVGATAERVDASGGRPEFVVPKSDYCEQCAYLSTPPDLECTYEGSTIVAVEDSENFRIRGCPFVDRDPDDPAAGLSPERPDLDDSNGDDATAEAGTAGEAGSESNGEAEADSLFDPDDADSVLDGDAPDPTIDPKSTDSGDDEGR